MQNLHCSRAGHASTCTLVVCDFTCARWHAINPIKNRFRIAFQMKFEMAFDHNFNRKGEVEIREAALSMNEYDEVWILIKFQLDFFLVNWQWEN